MTSEEKLEKVFNHVRVLLRGALKAKAAKPTLILVSRADVAGTDLALRPMELDGILIDASYLVPPGKVLVDLG